MKRRLETTAGRHGLSMPMMPWLMQGSSLLNAVDGAIQLNIEEKWISDSSATEYEECNCAR